MEHVLIPDPLPPGSLLGLVSPAGPAEPGEIDAGIRVLEAHGHQVCEGLYAREGLGFLAGEDDRRLADLLQLWVDPGVDAVFCTRGGYGTMRLLPRIPYDRLASSSKPLVGYSDVTALQWALWARCRLVSFSAPVVVDLGRLPAFSIGRLWTALEQWDWDGLLEDPEAALQVWRPGRAQGRLLPGNLTLITSLLGTPFFADLEGAILVLEDVDEQPYRLDRCLTQLRLAGVFEQIAGLVLGDFGDAFTGEKADPYWTLQRMVEAATRGTDFPVVAGIAYGHIDRRLTLPVGAQATLVAEPEPRLKVFRG